jgi:hypothetical protein
MEPEEVGTTQFVGNFFQISRLKFAVITTSARYLLSETRYPARKGGNFSNTSENNKKITTQRRQTQ